MSVGLARDRINHRVRSVYSCRLRQLGDNHTQIGSLFMSTAFAGRSADWVQRVLQLNHMRVK